MTMVHGKVGNVTVNAKDVSPFTNSIDWDTSADTSDVTTFGATGHAYFGGLTDGKVKLAGLYDNTVSVGPRAAVQASLGATVALIYRPEGISTGKPQTTVNVVVNSYKESVPVADMITWEAELTISGAPTTIVQP
jgi:hypothetical protein